MRSSRARKPRTEPPVCRSTTKPLGCRASQRSAMAADSSPSCRHTRSRIVGVILGSGGDRDMASPGLPVDRRQDARKIAEDELHVEDALQPLITIRGEQMVLEVGLDPPEDELVAVGVAPAEIPIDHVAGEIVREQSVRTGLDEGEVAEPVEQLADIGSVERRPQQGFGGDPGQGAGLQRLPLLRASGTVPRNRWTRVVHQVGRVDGQVDAAVPDDLVGQQRQAERMAVADRPADARAWPRPHRSGEGSPDLPPASGCARR